MWLLLLLLASRALWQLAGKGQEVASLHVGTQRLGNREAIWCLVVFHDAAKGSLGGTKGTAAMDVSS